MAWRPDLYSLRLFVAACDEASIARAAERESIVPSAVSKRIAEMEEAMSVELLVRGGRGVRPTVAGQTLLQYARQIMRSTEKLQSRMSEHAQGIDGHVQLVANISAIVEFLPRDLSSFLRGHPTIRVDLEERVSSAVVDAVKDSVADVGICLASVHTADLHVVPYAQDQLVLVTHAAHPLAQHASVDFSQALEYEFVGLPPDSRMSSFLTGVAARIGGTINYRMHVASFDVAAHIIAENLGIGLIPREAIQNLQQPLALRVIPVNDAWCHRDIVLCMRDYDALSPHARKLVDHLNARGAARRVAGKG